MRKRLEHWLGKELVYLSAEAVAGLPPGEGLRRLFDRLDQELRSVGLSLDDTVRTRLWARDRAGRDEASFVRTATLVGKRRSASSSYFSPSHFASDATVALDLVALRPANRDEPKLLHEYEPAAVPLRYLVWDSLVVLSGVTAVLPTLEEQLDDVLPRITDSLADAGVGWEKVVNVDFFVHRSLPYDRARDVIVSRLPMRAPRMGFELVDGFSTEGKLLETEVTARL